jgi:hypothetical protein
MLPAIRPDNGSSTREVGHLLRSLIRLFAGRNRFVTGVREISCSCGAEISHSQCCHKRGAAGKSINRGRAKSRPEIDRKENEIEITSIPDY